MCVHVRKGLALLRASHYGEITVAGSCSLRSTLAVVPVLFAQATVTVAKTAYIRHPYVCVSHSAHESLMPPTVYC